MNPAAASGQLQVKHSSILHFEIAETSLPPSSPCTSVGCVSRSLGKRLCIGFCPFLKHYRVAAFLTASNERHESQASGKVLYTAMHWSQIPLLSPLAINCRGTFQDIPCHYKDHDTGCCSCFLQMHEAIWRASIH